MRAKRLLPAVVLSVLALTGCGVQGLQWHPGIAASVGDQTITDKRVDELATDYCSAASAEIKQSGNVLPLRLLRGAIVRGLVKQSAAEQLAQQYGVKPDDSYTEAKTQAQASTVDLPSDQADAVTTLQSLDAYVSSISQGVGGVLLVRKGDTGASDAEKDAAGAQALARWIQSHTVDISPAFAITVTSGGDVDSGDNDVSFPVSTVARVGGDSQTNQGYAATLPANQVCG